MQASRYFALSVTTLFHCSGDEVATLERLLAGAGVVFKGDTSLSITTAHIRQLTPKTRGGCGRRANSYVLRKLEALLAFVMTYSVLNLKFARPAAALCGFVQRVLCIDDGTKVPSKAISPFRQPD